MDAGKCCLSRRIRNGLGPVMPYVLLMVFLLVLIFGPGIWVQRTMLRYARPADRYPGTGGQFARHLLDRLGLEAVKVEMAQQGGDHYDPEARVLRLTEDKLNSASLTAITVAAHEVGHAMQHRDGFSLFTWRSRLVRLARVGERVGAFILLAMPLVLAITRAPATGLFFLLGGFASIGLGTLVHLATLPVELDASFNRALPILEHGDYLKPEDRKGARKLLKAAAFTYVAASLMSLLNVWRWIRLVRP